MTDCYGNTLGDVLVIHLTDIEGNHVGFDPLPYTDMAEAHKAARRQLKSWRMPLKAEITDRLTGHVYYIMS